MTALKDLDPESSPRAFFGAELRRLRLAAHLTQDELGCKIGYTSSLLGLVEHARRTPTWHLARACDEILVGGGVLCRLWGLVDRSSSGPVTTGAVADLEADAVEVTAFGGLRVPWLLQTPGYARALLSARGDRLTSEAVERATGTLAERQSVVADKLSWVVLDESALRRCVGGREVMRSQVESIAAVAGRSPVTVQVVPTDAGEYAGLGGDFTLLSLAEGCRVGYLDGHVRYAVESETDVVALAHAFDLVRAAALPPRQSLSLVESIAGSL